MTDECERHGANIPCKYCAGEQVSGVSLTGYPPPEVIAMLRELIPTKIAEEIVGVQPMPSNLIKDVIDALDGKAWILSCGKDKE